MKHRRMIVCLACVLFAGVALAAEQGLDLPAAKIPGDKPGEMMHRYWRRQADQAAKRWQEEYEARKTPAQIASYQARLRGKFLEAIGGLPERTPLNAKVTGTVRREGYRVEKVIFESQPKHFVTALLFLPGSEGKSPPCPGVLVPCGHSKNGKGSDAYQTMGALLAVSGMAALVVDPIDQGERGQYLGKGGWPEFWGTDAHSLLGIGSTLLGRNTARFEIWDDMRAIDYLQSRPEVDPQRIGCTGNSGGGTQTSYMMALDERIRAAAPSCYLCGFPALLAHHRPAGRRAEHLRPTGLRHGPRRLHHDARAQAGADVHGHQGLLRYPWGLGDLPLCQAALHPARTARAGGHPRERRRAQLRQAAARRRRPLDVALAAEARTSRSPSRPSSCSPKRNCNARRKARSCSLPGPVRPMT